MERPHPRTGGATRSHLTTARANRTWPVVRPGRRPVNHARLHPTPLPGEDSMFRRPALVLPAALSAALALAACTDGGVTPPEVEPPLFGKAAPSSATAEAILDMMDAINAALEAQGADYRAAVAEYITPADGGEAGATLIARSLGNKHLGHDF